jgi:Plant protein of unknown function
MRLDELRMDLPGDHHATIPRVPAWLKKGNEELYEPRMLSIGPYHFCNSHLQAMEKEKLHSLRHLLELSPRVEIEVCVKEMRLLESTARDFYSNDIGLSSDDFVMMLLLDSCFILDFYIKVAFGGLNARWDTNFILSDIYLLENQIPFFVIHSLYHIFYGNPANDCSFQATCPLLKLILESPPFNYDHRQLHSRANIRRPHHLFALFYRVKLPDLEELDSVPEYSRFNLFEDDISAGADSITIPAASVLQKSGVTFRRMADAQHLFDIRFHNGILEMPFLKFSGATKIMLVNMIAFEHSQLINLKKKVLTSYVALLDLLINTDKDVSVLEQSGVFKNMLGNDNEAAKFFNELGASLQLNRDNHYYFDLLIDLGWFTNSIWHRYRARLFQDFSTNPWTFISVVTGAIALILTFIQTYYSAKP